MRASLSFAFLLFTVTFAGGTLTAPALSAPPAPGEPARWEYRVLTKAQVLDLGKNDLAAGLNRLGDEGWELAAVESDYIFKRPRQLKTLEDAKRQVAAAESALETQRDRAAWSARMARKGFVSDRQAEAEARRLKEAEAALDKARKELEAFPSEPKPNPEK